MLRVGRDAGSWPVRAFAGGHDVLLQQPQYVVGLLLFQDLRATFFDGLCDQYCLLDAKRDLAVRGCESLQYWRCAISKSIRICLLAARAVVAVCFYFM